MRRAAGVLVAAVVAVLVVVLAVVMVAGTIRLLVHLTAILWNLFISIVS